MSDLSPIKQAFDRKYAAWGLSLPTESLASRQRGSLVQNGWTIIYRFEDLAGAPCLEYFASHRMTNDSLHRIHADGQEELLGACQVFFVADDPQAEQEYYKHNREFYETVKQKGLWTD